MRRGIFPSYLVDDILAAYEPVQDKQWELIGVVRIVEIGDRLNYLTKENRICSFQF
jgi:hypothetical protein